MTFATLPDSIAPATSTVQHYGDVRMLTLPLSICPAIASFFTLLDMKSQFVFDFNHGETSPIRVSPSHDQTYWDADWRRCVPNVKSAWADGSLEGSWEGAFVVEYYSLITCRIIIFVHS
jgi:hypothetical protein